MIKLLAILLSVVMMFSSGTGEKALSPEEQKVADYVEENEKELLDSMEEGFATSSGMTCTSSIKPEGRGFIIQLNINELEDVSGETRTVLQETYDGIQGTFDSLLADMQTELPELQYFQILVCEKDGDILAKIEAKD